MAGYVNITSVGLAWDTVPATLSLTANGTTTWLAVARTSIEPELRDATPSAVASAAEELLAATRGAATPTELLAEHVAGWAAVWQRRG